VIVPVRDVDAVLTETEKPMVPVPLPLPLVTLSQLPVLEAEAPLQAHPGCVVTVTEPVPAPADTFCDAGDRAKVQVGAAPSCVTLTVWLPRLIVPVRDVAVVFAETEKPMVPVPLPLLLVTLSQSPVLEAVAPLHEHPGCVVTVTDPVPAAAETVWDAGPKLKVQVGAAACCVTLNVWLPTVIVPERDEVAVFSGAE
jgi:hypothetical protein